MTKTISETKLVVDIPFTSEPEDLLPLKMECVTELLARNVAMDEVLTFCRRADRKNREKFKKVLSEYFPIAA